MKKIIIIIIFALSLVKVWAQSTESLTLPDTPGVQYFSSGTQYFTKEGGDFTVRLRLSYESQKSTVYSDLYNALSRSGKSSWLMLPFADVWTGSYLDWTITFRLNTNNSNSIRDIRVGGAHVIQYPENPVFPILDPGTRYIRSDGSTTIWMASTMPEYYILYRNGVEVERKFGTSGGQIPFSSVNTAGKYTVKSAAGVEMSGSVTVVVVPKSTIAYQGEFWLGEGTPFDITINTSASGQTYDLYNGTTKVQSKPGGGVLTFTVSTAGTYTIKTATGVLVEGSVKLNYTPVYSITSETDIYGLQDQDVKIVLNGSSVGQNYILYRTVNGYVIESKPGTGSSLEYNLKLNTDQVKVKTETGVEMKGTVKMTAVRQFEMIDQGTRYIKQGQYCEIELQGSAKFEVYQLLRDGVVVKSLDGDGGKLTFSSYDFQSGRYTIRTNTGIDMIGSVDLVVVPIFSLVNSGTQYIGQGDTFSCKLSGSVKDQRYILYRDGVQVNSVLGHGGSSEVTFPTVISPQAGTYTVKTDSGIQMDGSIILRIIPKFSITNGISEYIGEGRTHEIGLSGSTVGQTYELYNYRELVASLPGTGNPLTFSGMFTEGNYTIKTSTGIEMKGSVVLHIQPVFSITKTGAQYCGEGDEFTITLGGSKTLQLYELHREGETMRVASEWGTGGAVDFTRSNWVSGKYTVETMQGVLMNGVVNLTVFPKFEITTPSPTYFSPGEQVTITLSGSVAGQSYGLYKGSTLVTTLTGTGSSLSFRGAFTAGTYNVKMQSHDVTMKGQVELIESTKFFIEGGPVTYAMPNQRFSIILSGSTNGVTYELYRNGNILVETHPATPATPGIPGTPGTPGGGQGPKITFNGAYGPGIYTIKGNGVLVDGQKEVREVENTIFSLTPLVYISSDNISSIKLSGSLPGETYILFDELNPTLGPLATMEGTGQPISFTGNFVGGCWYRIKTHSEILMDGLTQVSSSAMYMIQNDGERFIRQGENVEIELNGSDQYLDYELYRGTQLIQTKAGTGSKLIFSGAFTEGTYTIINAVGYQMMGEVILKYQSSTTQNENSVTRRSFTDETGNNYNTDVTYYDGFGRSEQSIMVAGSPEGNDRVSFTLYDCMGRSDSVSYEPFTVENNNGIKVTDLIAKQQEFWREELTGLFDHNYTSQFTEVQYDNSPLGIVKKIGQLGSLYKFSDSSGGYFTELGNRLNVDSDRVKKFAMASDDSSLQLTGYYPAGKLTVSQSQQQNLEPAGAISLNYVNSQGQTIATETRIPGVESRFTYYVYDEMGRHRFTIPPILEETLTANKTYTWADLIRYAYYLEYDENGNMVKQLGPGFEEKVFIYDAKNRLVMSQEGNMKAANKWNFFKYDQYDRTVYTGIVQGGDYTTHKAAIAAQDAQQVYDEKRGTGVYGYTNTVAPLVANETNVYNVTYYDDYAWQSGSEHSFVAADGFGQSLRTELRGVTTGSLTRVLDGTNNTVLRSSTYFDKNYNTIQSIEDLYGGGKEVASNRHDFRGLALETKVKQTTPNNTVEYSKTFEYDKRGRLLEIKQKVAGDTENGEVTIGMYERMESETRRGIGHHSGLIANLFEYDNQYRKIASMHFFADFTTPYAEIAYYDYDEDWEGIYPRYDGNMATKVLWDMSGDPLVFLHDYNRYGELISSKQGQQINYIYEPSNIRNEIMSYDKNGNILTMYRTDGNGDRLHDIRYNYTRSDHGSVVSSVTLNGVNNGVYDYDQSGNMIKDRAFGNTFEYNDIGLTSRVYSDQTDVKYVWDARGNKLASIVGGTSTIYRGPVVYSKASATAAEKVEYIINEEGFIAKENNNYVYKYLFKDLNGSVNSVYAIRKNADGYLRPYLEQQTFYYPYGLAWDADNLHLNKYLFSGKELQDANMGSGMLGLYDFGSRFYNPILGRWITPDPAYQTTNPYLYCGNSPMMFVDPDGEWFLSALLIGALIGGISYTASVGFSDGGFSNWNLGDFAKAMGIGALSGVVAGGVGQVYGATGSFFVEMERAMVHGFMQGQISQASGGNFLTGFATSAISSGIGSSVANTGFGESIVGMYAISGVSGGISAQVLGGQFWEGFATSMIIAGTNHAASHVIRGRQMEKLREAGLHEFADVADLHAYMDEYSYRNGIAYKEHASYEFAENKNGEQQGGILLPVDKNTFNESHHFQKLLKLKKGKVYFAHFKKPIASYTHTHMLENGTKPSPEDMNYMRYLRRYGVKSNILYQKYLYRIHGDGSVTQLPGAVR